MNIEFIDFTLFNNYHLFGKQKCLDVLLKYMFPIKVNFVGSVFKIHRRFLKCRENQKFN